MKGTFRPAFFALALILFAAPVFGQKGIKLGFLALPQTSWMLNQDDMEAPLDEFEYKTTFGMAAGPTFGYNFNDGLGFRMNFIYSAQGQRYANINDEGTTVNHTRRLNYLKVPLMFHFNTNTSYRKIIFSAAAGFQFNLLARARYYNDDQSYTPDEALWDNVTEYPTTYQRYSWADMGPVLNLGIEVKMKYNLMANVGVRADYSITDAENKNAAYKLWTFGVPDDVTYYPDGRAKTSNMNAGLVFGFTYTISQR